MSRNNPPSSDTRREVEDLKKQWQLGLPQGLSMRLLAGVLALYLGLIGYVGVRLWGQIDANTEAIANDQVHSMQVSTTIEHIKEEVEELKQETKENFNKVDEKLERLLDRP